MAGSGASVELGVAVIGAGPWGLNHVRVFGDASGCRLRWVCDVREEARQRVASSRPEVAVAASLEPILDDPRVAAVVIASPAATHAELACQALAAGKHVLIEKPLALTVADGERVVAAARAANRVALVGHLMLFHPALLRLGVLVRSGELGPIRYLHSKRVNLGRMRVDENALWSLGAHDVSMLEHLLGEPPISVSAQGGAYLQAGIEDVVFVTLRFAGGVIAQVHLSWLDPRRERRLTVIGAKKMAELDDVAADKLRVFDRGYDACPDLVDGEGLPDGRVAPVEMREPLSVMAGHFIEACAGRVAPRSDAASGLRVVKVLAAAQESLRNGGKTVALTPS